MLAVSSLAGFTDAHLFFVARTTAPAFVSPFYRLLTMLQDSRREPINRIQGVLRTLADCTVAGGTLVRLREAYSLSFLLPSDLLLTQVGQPFIRRWPFVD